MAPSGSKDDPTDAALCLQMLVKHRDQLRPWRPDDAQTRLIRLLAEDRRGLIAQRTRLCNQLQDRLKQVFPLALEVLGSLTTELAAARRCLAAAGFREIQEQDVVVVPVENEPGAAAGVFQRIADAHIDVRYSYMATGNRLVISASNSQAVLDALGV